MTKNKSARLAKAPLRNWQDASLEQNVIASEAKQSIAEKEAGLLRRFAPRNDSHDGLPFPA